MENTEQAGNGPESMLHFIAVRPAAWPASGMQAHPPNNSHTHPWMHARMPTCMHMCLHARTSARTHAHPLQCMYTRLLVRPHAHMPTRIRMQACRGLPYCNGADQQIGLQAVRVLDAMYRSAASGKTERAL